jgi:hypothetical protein
VKANKQYKDGLFRSLFNNKGSLLELYNALEGTDCQDESVIEINTLQNVLFSSIKNDISFTVDDKMVIVIEHQSTINENMPLRLLSYITRIYENMTDKRIYRESLLEIPKPKFTVLYNGKVSYPKEKFLRLSNAFKKTDNDDSIPLDLTVRVLNINKGYNPDLEQKSKILDGYAIFTAKVREYEDKYPLEEAIKLALKYCMENDILKEYLEQHLSEVIDMSMLEYNLKDAIEVAREEAMEKGIEKGIEKGVETGMEKGQNYVLGLMAQGLSYEEIKKRIEDSRKDG